jgi:hypothetical protein
MKRIKLYVLAFLVLIIYSQTQDVFGKCPEWQRKIDCKDSKKLQKSFGIVLPTNSPYEIKRYKLSESKVVYLLIKMSEEAKKEFISNLKNIRKPKNISVGLEDPDCRKAPNCPIVGMVFYPSDSPDEEKDKWEEINNFRSDTIASFREVKGNRIKSYASFFLDSKRGLLILWYKL